MNINKWAQQAATEYAWKHKFASCDNILFQACQIRCHLQNMEDMFQIFDSSNVSIRINFFLENIGPSIH